MQAFSCQTPVRRWACSRSQASYLRPRSFIAHCTSQAPPVEVPQTFHSRSLSPQQLQQLHGYLDYLLEVNKTMNLTAVREPSEAWQRHIEDSLALLPAIEEHMPAAATGTISAIDVGTGPGLPGMVLAIARPNWQMTLLDSLRKRCDFMQKAADQIGLKNVQVVWSRAEEAGQKPELRERHDLAVARAVAETRVLAELCLPFVRVGGMWVAAKGPNPQVEVAAASNAFGQCGGKLRQVALVESYSPEGQRTAVVVAKVGHTQKRYPRVPGTPNKKPL